MSIVKLVFVVTGEGLTIREVAEQFSVGEATIKRRLKEYGLNAKSIKLRAVPYEKLKKFIIALKASAEECGKLFVHNFNNKVTTITLLAGEITIDSQLKALGIRVP